MSSLELTGIWDMELPHEYLMAKQQVHLPLDTTELNPEPALALCMYLSRAAAPFPAGGLALRDLPTSSEPREIATWELRQAGLQANKS